MVQIPPVPEGIFDANDLYNDSYNQLPNLRWSNPEFHDRIAWLRELIGFDITAWGAAYSGPAGPGPGAREHRSSTHFQVLLDGTGVTHAVDVVNISTDPRSVYTTLFFLKHGAAAELIPPYPGLLVRHPVGGLDPIGALWPEHPHNAKNRVIFHPSKDFEANRERWPLSTNVEKPTEFLRADGRYTLHVQYTPGPGLFGYPFTPNFFWQRDYSK
jgi:hypothetical protein